MATHMGMLKSGEITVGDYSLEILVPATEEEGVYRYVARMHTRGDRGEMYVSMFDATPYAVGIRNMSEDAASAEISIDGVVVGTWILGANGSAAIERPVFSANKFVFNGIHSSSAMRVGAVEGKPSNGVVSVKFTPEKARRVQHFVAAPSVSSRETAPSAMPAGVRSMAAASKSKEGVTTLGEKSDQKFRSVYFSGDNDRALTVNVTLEIEPRVEVHRLEALWHEGHRVAEHER